MNDEFLIQFREVPRVEFADALYKRISQQSQPGFAFTIWNKLTLRNAGALLVLIVVVAACAYYAATQTPYHKVGEIWLTVQKTYVPEFIPVSETPEENPVESQAYDCPLFSVEEARGILRFDVLVPTWAPEGFTFTDAVCGVDAISDFVSLTWTGNDGNSYIGITSQNLR